MIPALKLYSRIFSIKERCIRPAFVYPVLVGIFLPFMGCKSPVSADSAKAAARTGIIQLPVPGPLDVEEKIRLQKVCSHWYDSVLGRTNFNGGMLVAKNGHIIFEKYHGNPSIGSPDS